MSIIIYALLLFFFFFNDTATTEIYTLSLHDALPISRPDGGPQEGRAAAARAGRHQDHATDRATASGREPAAGAGARADADDDPVTDAARRRWASFHRLSCFRRRVLISEAVRGWWCWGSRARATRRRPRCSPTGIACCRASSPRRTTSTRPTVASCPSWRRGGISR